MTLANYQFKCIFRHSFWNVGVYRYLVEPDKVTNLVQNSVYLLISKIVQLDEIRFISVITMHEQVGSWTHVVHTLEFEYDACTHIDLNLRHYV